MSLILKRKTHTAQFFQERLSETVSLDMVLILGGSFLMGSPEDELGRYDDESFQHAVTVSSFCMGKYPVTQAQYQTVMGSNPANFKEDDFLPVEQVSWKDAVAFCDRMSQLTEREYRLPSEAEWEYACRAETKTPFHFGETITTDLANYRGTADSISNRSCSYGRGSKGIYRKKTTPVGTFPANAFGLYDMHGNVWEWCLDHWHDNYKGAPTEGSAWLSADKSLSRLLRGGSWSDYPWVCRSAVRSSNSPDDRINYIGFRVVCSAART